MMRNTFLVLAACLLAACAATPRIPAAAPVAATAAAGTHDTERTLLVMLRLPPPHYRLGAGYAGGYNDRAGRAALLRVARRLAVENKLELVSEWAMPAIDYDCFVMRTAAGESLAAVRDRLSRSPDVALVQEINTFHSLGHNDPLYPLQPAGEPWHLAALHGIATGHNVIVASIDTGVEVTHPDLRGRIDTAQNFVDGSSFIAEMHGTAVAGIIGGRADNSQGIVGIAPRAKLLVLRACWQNADDSGASCNSFTLAKAMQFAIDRGARVINLSLGGPSDPLLERLIDSALARGISVVGAVDPRLGDGGFPASHPGVIAVAATDAGAPFPAGAVQAPGKDVPAPLPGGGWGFVTGSSFSAAEVSGMVAMMRELAPAWTPGRIRATLAPQRTGVSDSAQGPMDPCAAIALTGGICACNCTQKNQKNLSTPH